MIISNVINCQAPRTLLASVMSRPEFHTLKVSSVRQLTDDSVAISFAVPESLTTNYTFVPGEYLTLRAAFDGEEVRRSYSICSEPGDALEVGIKHLPGGIFSTFAQGIAQGDELDVMTPQGSFTAEPCAGNHYLLVAAGSGITPCLSIAKTKLAQESASSIMLLYGNRSTASIMFRQDINDLKDRYMDRIMIVNVLSREKQEADWLNGRVDEIKIKYLIDNNLLDVDSLSAAFVCGPMQMVECVKAALGNDVVIKTELFTTEASTVSRKKVSSVSSPRDSVDVTITLDGTEYVVAVRPQIDTVLSAAQRAGLDLPFSCAGGMCCTCRCKVVSGKTSMDQNFSLAAWEVEAGFTLACQTRPLGGSVVLDFDEH